MAKLAPEQIESRLQELSEWSLSNDAIMRTYQFDDFNEAIAFVNRVAEYAEHIQHHPEILIRYNKVTLTLTTHDQDGVTDRDIEFATVADDFLGARA
jgi:4a-hydroxytetrahydrobiopterin dehydratase